ncbi:MAG TPA: hypothetical protein VKZ56_10575 [Membranihabitans sp.]|nr:hypothetical protein [Membranihabitans sp.]
MNIYNLEIFQSLSSVHMVFGSFKGPLQISIEIKSSLYRFELCALAEQGVRLSVQLIPLS